MIDSGANIECSDLHFGRPLHLAALKGYVYSAKVLLLAGTEFRSNSVVNVFLDHVTVNGKSGGCTVKLIFVVCGFTGPIETLGNAEVRFLQAGCRYLSCRVVAFLENVEKSDFTAG